MPEKYNSLDKLLYYKDLDELNSDKLRWDENKNP